MTMTDPIADMLTRIRNALQIHGAEVSIPSSKMKQRVADALKREGFIEDFEVTSADWKGEIKITLKYGPDGEHVIRKIRRDSKPGKRVYAGVEEIDRVLNGVGVAIYSTSKGVLSDRECRQERVGGERLATVW